VAVAEIAEDPVPTTAEVRAKIAEMKRKKEASDFPKRDTKSRRAAEAKQRKDRVNFGLLNGTQGPPSRDERWTILARPDLIGQVKQLAEDLSRPRAKVSFAALMEEAMKLLIAHYQAIHDAETQEIQQ
jgi:hypothetical protein